MKLISIPIIFGLVIGTFASAMTIEEYVSKPPEEKIKVLNGKPERLLQDQSQLLRLYTISLRDRLPAVQRAASQASVLLLLGLQSAKPRGLMPDFSDEDSAAFQQTLAALVQHHDASIRLSAAIALAYSAPPNDVIEGLLLSRVANEPMQGLKAGILEAMSQAGYNSDQFVVETIALIQPEADTKAIYSAARVLAQVKPDAALDTLISLASENSPSQRHSLQALAAYGQKAAQAKPMLEALLANQFTPEDIRNLARITLGAITTDMPQASSLKIIPLVRLWPLAVRGSEPLMSQQPQQVTTEPSNSLTITQVKVPKREEPISKTFGGKLNNKFTWVAGAVLLAGIMIWLALKLRS